jgi:tetratricopeptide (TPR) repeat protein
MQRGRRPGLPAVLIDGAMPPLQPRGGIAAAAIVRSVPMRRIALLPSLFLGLSALSPVGAGALAVVGPMPGLAPTAAWAQGQPIEPDQALDLARRRVQRRPRDSDGYRRLGDAFVLKARASGDMSYLARAEEALKKSVELTPESAGAWSHLAYVFVTRHQFAEAVTHAARAIALDAGGADAYGVLGDALLELGRYEEAATAYRRMVELDGSLASYSRLSGLKNLHGDVEGAIADLELAIRLGKANASPREAVAWAHWQLGGEHFALGNLEAAEGQYRQALDVMPGYYRGLSGLAQVRAAQGRLEEAAELYRKSLEVIPLPETAAALGDVHARLGRADEARRQYAVVEYIGTLNAANQAMYNRELALFYADHDIKLDRALDLTEREIKERKDIYGHDALAWVLYKSGRPAEASAAITEALKLGTRDPRLFFHAGMIHARLGDHARAREYLEQVRALNPRFHVLHAAVAERTLAELRGGPGGPGPARLAHSSPPAMASPVREEAEAEGR